jgi:uncharacterized protein YkwD
MLRAALMILTMALVAACAPEPERSLGPDGKPLPRVYRIRTADENKIQFRMLDAINALRSAAGQAPVALNARLTAAAETHARDMALQNRPWHFGSDGSSPIDRATRVGYEGTLLGENISETFETELETLAAWMDNPNTRRIILSPSANDMGFAWLQEPSGKLWWVLEIGRAAEDPLD